MNAGCGMMMIISRPVKMLFLKPILVSHFQMIFGNLDNELLYLYSYLNNSARFFFLSSLSLAAPSALVWAMKIKKNEQSKEKFPEIVKSDKLAELLTPPACDDDDYDDVDKWLIHVHRISQSKNAIG